MSRSRDELKRYGESLADAVTPARSRVVAMRAIARVQRRSPRRSLLRVAAVTAGFLAIANVAVAGVADSAVPGDLLYPVDRGFERAADIVGLGGDRTEERLDEATVLVDRSDLTTAIDLVDESVTDPTVTAAVAAIEQANGPDSDLKGAVMDLISGARDISMAARDGNRDQLAAARGEMRQFASRVSEAARAQNGQGGPPEDTGRPDDLPADPGPPDGVEPPGQDGTPPGQGGDPPGRGESPPGHDGTTPGETAPGQGDSPGQSGDSPGQSSDSPGQGGGSKGGNSSGRP